MTVKMSRHGTVTPRHDHGTIIPRSRHDHGTITPRSRHDHPNGFVRNPKSRSRGVIFLQSYEICSLNSTLIYVVNAHKFKHELNVIKFDRGLYLSSNSYIGKQCKYTMVYQPSADKIKLFVDWTYPDLLDGTC